MRVFLLALAIIVIAGCGGGGESSPRPRVVVAGDSILSGAYNTKVDGVYEWHDPRPAVALARLSGLEVLDRTTPGQTATEGALSFTTPQAGDIVVVCYVVASALKGLDLIEYETALRSIVAKSAGSKVVLVGGSKIDNPNSLLSDMELTVSKVAASTGAIYVPIANLKDAATIDGVHPDKKYSEAIVQVIYEAAQIYTATPSR